ncbi:hypothetical protein H072_835 [Dactylellina haptotyla CBS 200.50]|uniref:Uncharacterized protein n=1 Tax=Dactylellina haptotyla (strain CBS 200.50) TaxID=1284197 RepID=S8C0B6_DACHA|nr:hypothetical protein H072_835 [Dactylellina haptotyla CBS 200.50]
MKFLSGAAALLSLAGSAAALAVPEDRVAIPPAQCTTKYPFTRTMVMAPTITKYNSIVALVTEVDCRGCKLGHTTILTTRSDSNYKAGQMPKMVNAREPYTMYMPQCKKSNKCRTTTTTTTTITKNGYMTVPGKMVAIERKIECGACDLEIEALTVTKTADIPAGFVQRTLTAAMFTSTIYIPVCS